MTQSPLPSYSPFTRPHPLHTPRPAYYPQLPSTTLQADFPGTGSSYEGEMRMGKFHGTGVHPNNQLIIRLTHIHTLAISQLCGVTTPI